jgi:hypothetical protein
MQNFWQSYSKQSRMVIFPTGLRGENRSHIVRFMDPKEKINAKENTISLASLSLSNTDSYKLYVKVYTVYGLNAVMSTVTRPKTC